MSSSPLPPLRHHERGPARRHREAPAAQGYRLEVTDPEGQSILAAALPAGVLDYRSPPWLAERAPGGAIRWRVVALDIGGEPIRRTDWRELRFEPGAH